MVIWVIAFPIGCKDETAWTRLHVMSLSLALFWWLSSFSSIISSFLFWHLCAWFIPCFAAFRETFRHAQAKTPALNLGHTDPERLPARHKSAGQTGKRRNISNARNASNRFPFQRAKALYVSPVLNVTTKLLLNLNEGDPVNRDCKYMRSKDFIALENINCFNRFCETIMAGESCLEL